MKKRIFILLIPIGVCFMSCRKDPVAPEIKKYLDTQKVGVSPVANAPVPPIAAADTAIIAGTSGYLRVQLAKDAVNTDNVLIEFSPKASATFVRNEDAPTFAGFGQVSLSSLSSDNVDLAINMLPLPEHGATVKLAIGARTNGTYKLNLTTCESIPASCDVWLMDKYRSDSLDFRHYPTYIFDLYESDTSSYGSNRFKLVIRKH